MRISLKPWALDAVISFLDENGLKGSELKEGPGACMLLAYCKDERTSESLRCQLMQYAVALEEIHGDTPIFSIELEQLQDPGWAQAWKVHFKPCRISQRLAVCPPWESYEGPEGVWVIQVEPGQAFGTGLHETTRLCLEFLDELLSGSQVPASAVDLGTGTGILAMAMAKLGVKRVVALDRDPLAVDAARENLRLNQLLDRVDLIQGDLDSMRGSLFPLLVANLTGKTLRENARQVSSLVELGGSSILSGILCQEWESVCESFKRFGMVLKDRRTKGDWIALVMAREK
ncbi:MAG: 50S ribosomal protein L11 methyltransferase [bacterium]